MRTTIFKYKPEGEYYISERCHITEQSNSDADPEMSIAQARVEVGVTTRWHRLLGMSERYVILAGQGRMEVGDLAPTDVSVGDVVVIPPDVPQRISNTGDEDLIFSVICMPRFTADVYDDLDDEMLQNE